MPKIMESYHTYKYSYDSPSIDYDDDPNKAMKWKDSEEVGAASDHMWWIAQRFPMIFGNIQHSVTRIAPSVIIVQGLCRKHWL